MSRQEHIIAGIHEQKNIIKSLVNRFRDKDELDDIDGYVFSVVIKQVEKELRALNGMLQTDLFSDLSKQFSNN